MRRVSKKKVKEIIAHLESDELVDLLSAMATLVGTKGGKLIDFDAVTVTSREPDPREIEAAKTILLTADTTAIAAYWVFDLLGVKINVVMPDAAAAIAASLAIGRPWRAVVERYYKCIPSEYVVRGSLIMPQRTQSTAASLLVRERVAEAAILLGAHGMSV